MFNTFHAQVLSSVSWCTCPFWACSAFHVAMLQRYCRDTSFFFQIESKGFAVASDIKCGVIEYSQCSLTAVNYCQKRAQEFSDGNI